MATASSLYSRLIALDGKPYGALKSLTGAYTFGGFTLHIDKVQSDPYAPPSLIRLVLPLAVTSLPNYLLRTGDQRIAARDFIARDIADAIAQGPREFGFRAPGQEILDRSSVVMVADSLEVRLTFGFPAAGRRIKGRAAASLLVDALADLVRFSVLGEELDIPALQRHVETYTDFLWVQNQLADKNLVAFIADGSRLARTSGDSDTPAQHNLPFVTPESLAVQFALPSGRTVTGLGISQGISLIVGGGYHGKSTLLKALERGVYAHIPGDGRELVVTLADAVAVRAEDGRAVHSVDISPFISGLPGGVSTQSFSTANASGSTSQAANIAEALELGTSVVLIDEDTSATNFMIRDDAMRALIDDSCEPIRPFVERARALYEELGVSTIMVVGGSGAFFGVADTVLAMSDYRAADVTSKAHAIARAFPAAVQVSGSSSSFFAQHKGDEAVRWARSGALGLVRARKSPRARGLQSIQVDRKDIDMRYVSQLVDVGQTQGIALALALVEQDLGQGAPLVEAVDRVCAEIAQQGVDRLSNRRVRGDVVVPRPAEVMAAINRYRRLQVL